MTVTELIGHLQALELLGHGGNRIAIWDEDNRVTKHIKHIDSDMANMAKNGFVVIDVSVLPV